MNNKPDPSDFTHNGVLQQPHYDNAVKAWEKIERMEVTVKAEFVFEFTSKLHWVAKARNWFAPYKYDKLICIAANNSICHIGEDFMLAEENNLYPVKCYRLKRTVETVPPLKDN